MMKMVMVEGSVVQKEELTDRERWQHLADLADFALAMKVSLMNINYQSFNNFMLRIGNFSAIYFKVREEWRVCPSFVQHAYHESHTSSSPQV